METLLPYLQSAEGVWLLWLAGIAVLLGLARAALTDFRLAGWRQLLQEEDGAAYTISFVLTFPFYVAFVLLVVETTLFLIVKIGTVHAAYAAARSHIVWSSLDANKAKTKREQAAVNVMAAFASSKGKHIMVESLKSPPSPAVAGEALRYYAAYRAYDLKNDHPGSSRYIIAKYTYARIATKVTVQESSNAWNADVSAKVEYEMPFQLSFVGRIIGHRVIPLINVYTYSVRSTVTLPNDAPRNDTKKLGIDYVPPNL
jgi:hypothetical protein